MKEMFFQGKNCFGYDKFSPLIVFTPSYSRLRKKIKKDIETVLFQSGNQYFENIESVIMDELAHLNSQVSLSEIELRVERLLHPFFQKDQQLQGTIKERGTRIYKQILYGFSDLNLSTGDKKNFLDVGAGSGLVTSKLCKHFQPDHALMIDILDYRMPEVADDNSIAFSLFRPPFDKIDTTKKFDVCVITNTLHHCNQPKAVFETALRYMNDGGLFFIVESCIGLNEEVYNKYPDSPAVPYQSVFTSDGRPNPETKEFVSLSFNEQMIYGSFFDWLFNRVFVNSDINVPFNFGKPEDWDYYFNQKGLSLLRTYVMGFDQPAVLEFHTLHILKKG